MTPPNYLDTSAVMARYGFRDPRAARSRMRAAGCVRVGGRLLCNSSDLDAHDATDRIIDTDSQPINDQPLRTTPTDTRFSTAAPDTLEAGWWEK